LDNTLSKFEESVSNKQIIIDDGSDNYHLNDLKRKRLNDDYTNGYNYVSDQRNTASILNHIPKLKNYKINNEDNVDYIGFHIQSISKPKNIM